MTRDEVIQLAMQAGLLDKADCSDDYFIPGDAFIAEIEEFVSLVAAAEREACALMAESYEPTCESCPSGVANAIRHRGIKDDRDTESN